jgi:SAM-dependent methyltransferase
VSAVGYAYDDVFFASIERGSQRSASVVVPLVLRSFAVQSVLDVGCGRGAWLAVWRELGVAVHGVDGAYVDARALLVPAEHFTGVDLARPFALGRRFDLVQCLEVAEHLPPAAAEGLVSSLCAHGDAVLFSAAPPGQGGEHHVNERPYTYWRELFRAHGYELFDPYRAALAGRADVEPWYRYNTFLYVQSARVTEALERFRVPAERAPVDVAPPLYRFRRRVVGLLPISVMTAVAQAKKHLVVRWLRLRG